MRARRILALLSATAGLSIIVPVSTAQMRAPSTFPIALGPPRTISFNQIPFNRPHRLSGVVLGVAPYLYADYPSESPAIPAAPSQIIVVPSASAPDPAPETRAEPLLIELQGNRYVRFGGLPQSAGRGVNVSPDYAQAENSTPGAAPAELPAAVLIFRDGHREQVREYVIVSGVLYADQNYWQNGRWTKNIQLATLDLPATAKVNRDNGLKFMLPSAPNEVVTRP